MKYSSYLIIFLCVALTACVNKNSPEYVTKQYLLALKNKNWDEAKKYCDDAGIQNLECSIRMGYTDMGISEVKDITCKTENKKSECEFCCWPDTLAVITLHKYPDGKWKVGGVKESCPDEVSHEETERITPDTILNSY